MNEQPTGKTYVGSDELYADVQRCMRLVAEMNTDYHTEADVPDNMVVAGSPAKVIREIRMS